MADQKKENQNPKDGLALIIGGLFILALVFAAYNYFSKGAKSNNTLTDDNTPMFEKLSNDNKKNNTGDLDGKGAKTGATNTTDTTKSVDSKDTVTTTQTTAWVANNYNPGDIKAGSYTVKKGDTLWEIAEAAYGKGSDWHKILEANKSSIGHLANGSQALIVPGQVLVLP